jgi:transcriptional regulator with PAS, ATPase and Fis domain
LLESELFGHKAGAFTGATQSRRGLFQEAHEGTLFLDEIGDLSLLLQAKLLRAIQEQRIKPVGENEEVPVDVRVVAATHRDLEAMVKTGLFREDLYYRLNVVSIRIPPLRERRDDIPILVEHFLMKYQATGRTAPRISDAAIELLRRYRWPGNVRELENAVERALLLCKDGLITPDLLPAGLDVEPVDSATDSAPEWVPLDDMIETYVARVIEHAGGNLSHAARILGVSRRTLQRMAERRRRTGEPGDNSSHSGTD